MTTASCTRERRLRAALKMLYVGDSLAMPAHWFYRRSDIQNTFDGGIRDLRNAPARHPAALMSLHSTRAGGRTSLHKGKALPEVVGDVILKGRAHLWEQGNRHYHHGMKAGENTLNAHCARILMRCLGKQQAHYDSEAFLVDYIAFMTADPPSHPDTYAESFHRAFFANWINGKMPAQCAGKTHDTPSIGGLVMICPLAIVLLARGDSLARCQQLCRQHLALTHPDDQLAQTCDALVSLTRQLLYRDSETSVSEVLEQIARSSAGMDLALMTKNIKQDADVVGGIYSHACYIDGAWPSVLFLLYRYQHDTLDALLSNTNLGGDNVHRGAVLGALLGLADAEPADRLFEQLADASAIEAEIGTLLRALPAAV